MNVTACTPSPDDHSDTAALAPVPRCRLCVAFVGGAESVAFTPIADHVVGPSLTGVPVLASDGSTLAIVGHLDDGSTHVWSGTPEHLDRRTELAADLQLAALVHHRGTWHLFGALDGSQPYHAVSHDLATWWIDGGFADEHPQLRVHGAASTRDGLVVLGRVVAGGRAIGWTLLVQDDPPDPGAPFVASAPDFAGVGVGQDVADQRRPTDSRPFRAREITFPLAPDHRVVGPATVRGDELAMAVTTGSSRMIARTAPGSRGRSWTLGLLSPDVEAAAVFARGRDVWVAGVDPAGGSPMVSVVGRRSFHLDRSGGAVCAAVAHGDHLVLARLPVAGDAHGEHDETVESAGAALVAAPAVDLDDQSSPAYIDSISAA